MVVLVVVLGVVEVVVVMLAVEALFVLWNSEKLQATRLL